MPTDAKPTEPAGVQVFDAWKALGEGDGLVPYLDYSTPQFYDQITAAVQQLMAGRQPAKGFTGDLQDDYEKFTGSL
jgi:raffinose/stachyose/melibiose transport system substrate-binding protein